jgi:hypothetical protein
MFFIIEFFLGIIAVFLVGYILALALEKIFHINLNPDHKNE